MFGSSSNPFGQSSSPFGSPSGFGQTSNASSNNLFAPKPFGNTPTTPFGSQTGTSLFGGTSTGVFGAATQSPSPFGASSSPAFGSSTPAFGASSAPAFGSSSSPFGGSSVFGQKPAFGAFGSTTAQPSPFGGTSQPSQSAFGSSLFGSSAPFGASSTPAFGASSTPAFGASTTPAFGASTTPAFGTSTTQLFGTGASVGSPLFGSGGAFGATTSPAFGATTSPAFGATTAPAFSASTASAFGASTTPTFSFASSPAFGQSASAFGSNPFGSSTSPFGTQTSMFGTQSTTPAFGNTGFGQTAFGAQRGGSRVAPYAPTTEPDNSSSGVAGKLESISAMPVYKDKSHEELRWEDYQVGDKGGPMPAAQPSGINFNTPAPQPSILGQTPAFSQSPSSLFSNITSNPFAPKTSTPAFSSAGFGATPSSSPSLFNPSSTPSLFSTTSAPFSNTSSSLFPSTTPSFAPSTFSPQVPASTPGFGSSTIFPSVTPSGQTGSAFGLSTATFGQSTTPPFNQSNVFSSPSTGFANAFSTAPSLAVSTYQTPSFPGAFTPAQPAQPTFSSYSIFPQPQPGNSVGAAMGMFGNLAATQSPAVVQPVPATNPFGTLPAMPEMSIGRGGTAPSVQYGISSMPVSEKAAPVRISSYLTSRHLSQRRIRLPARKYNPKTDGTKVPFFSDDYETDSTPKADALFLSRENPRALVIRPADHWPPKPSAGKASSFKDTSPKHENGLGKFSEEARPAVNGFQFEDKDKDPLEDDCIVQEKEKANSVKNNQKANGVHDDHAVQKEGSYITLSGHRAGEAAIVYEHGAGIEALMPKLRHSDYYTEPRIQELAAKERAEPGFCQHVKNFVVGRHGYGSIKFFGETDVRRLDLESLVQFNNREVIVYLDDSKKPPVGQGLNKPAEVTLLNIKCFDKKTGRHCTEGPKIEKYVEMLKRKAKDQGAEFVSYDPINGEWKFRVDHFSEYKLAEEDEEGFDVEDDLHC